MYFRNGYDSNSPLKQCENKNVFLVYSRRWEISRYFPEDDLTTCFYGTVDVRKNGQYNPEDDSRYAIT